MYLRRLSCTLQTCPVKDKVSIQDNAAVSLGVNSLESAKSAMLRGRNRTWLILVPRTRFNFFFFFFSCDGNGDAARDLHTNNVHHEKLQHSKTDATR